MAIRKFVSEKIIIDISDSSNPKEYTGPWPDPLQGSRLHLVGTRAELEMYKMRAESGITFAFRQELEIAYDGEGRAAGNRVAGVSAIGGLTGGNIARIRNSHIDVYELPDITNDATVSTLANPAVNALEAMLSRFGFDVTLQPNSRSWISLLGELIDEVLNQPSGTFNARNFTVRDANS